MCRFIKVVTSSKMSEPRGEARPFFQDGRRKYGLKMDEDRVQKWIMRSVEVELKLASRERWTAAR
jgi:hypothetical protein